MLLTIEDAAKTIGVDVVELATHLGELDCVDVTEDGEDVRKVDHQSLLAWHAIQNGKPVEPVDQPPPPATAPNPVDHPPHYNAHPSGVECIEITEHMGFCLGNAMKYLWRADSKGHAIEDLRKARWYLDREIARRTADIDGTDAS